MICHRIKASGTEQAAREPGSGLLDPPAGCHPFDSTRQWEEGETQCSLGSSSLLDHINPWSVSDLYKTTNMQEECLIKLCWLQHQHPRDNNEGSATWLASSVTVLGRTTLLKMWTLEEKKEFKKPKQTTTKPDLPFCCIITMKMQHCISSEARYISKRAHRERTRSCTAISAQRWGTILKAWN